MTDLREGVLLLAAPHLAGSVFADTVVLMLDVNDDGALGVVLNRPSELGVAQVLGAWAEVVGEPGVLFSGGPVETDGALAVALRRSDDDQMTVGLRAVVGRLALLDLDTPVELVRGDLSDLRIFAGYSGWGAGQLQDEISRGDWTVVPGDASDVFRSDYDALRRDVLRRQPGDLAWHLTRPIDPQQN